MNASVVGPGAAIPTRPLHFFFLVDCSGSMSNKGKIQALNNAVREVIPHLRQEAAYNTNATILVSAIKFSGGAQWHIPTPTPVHQLRWQDLGATPIEEEVTDMGAAFLLLAEQLRALANTRGLPPVLVLMSDGEPTDDWESGLRVLMQEPWAKHAIRVAFAIGSDAKLGPLQKFINDPERQPLQANNPEGLVRLIVCVS